MDACAGLPDRNKDPESNPITIGRVRRHLGLRMRVCRRDGSLESSSHRCLGNGRVGGNGGNGGPYNGRHRSRRKRLAAPWLAGISYTHC